MSTEDRPPLGKFGKKSLENYVFPYLDNSNGKITAPEFGSDFNAVGLGDEKVLVVSTDPLAISPELGWERSGRLALQVITTDVAVSGIAPDYLVSNWNLPPATRDEIFEKIWRGFTKEATRVGIRVVGGHTGRYQGSSFPVVGAGTAFGVGEKEDLVSGELTPGDKIYLLNEVGVEAAAIFASYYPESLSGEITSDHLSEVKRRFDGLQPTRKLSFLSSCPGVKTLHDVAERGLLGGLQETLAGRDCGARIGRDRIEIHPAVSRICSYVDLDPLQVTSIGSGIAVVSPELEAEFLEAVNDRGFPVQAVGEIKEGEDLILTSPQGEEILSDPVHDEFWERLSEFP